MTLRLPVRRPDGPTPGSIASEGAGGGYLSNEVAYRNTLQRDLLHPAMPAGHLHEGAHAILRNAL